MSRGKGRYRTAVGVKRHKFGAVATVVDGIRFASKAEAKRFGELKMLEKAGQVTCLECQPRYDLYVIDVSVGARLRRAARGLRTGTTTTVTAADHIKIGTYVADFRYSRKGLSASENEHWHVVVEDVKGVMTPLARWKIKHTEAQYGITVQIIK